MQLIKSIIYSFLNNLWGIIIPIVIIVPSAVFKSRKIADKGAKIWSVFSLWMLKKLCRIDFRVIDVHNILSEPCIYA
jgi:hypothetical protein